MTSRAANKILDGLQNALRSARCEHQWIWFKASTRGKAKCWFCPRCGTRKHQVERT